MIVNFGYYVVEHRKIKDPLFLEGGYTLGDCLLVAKKIGVFYLSMLYHTSKIYPNRRGTLRRFLPRQIRLLVTG